MVTRCSVLRLQAASAVAAMAGFAGAQESPELREKARETLPIERDFTERPVLVGDRLIWENHALLDLCQEFGGSFRKLTGRREYACRLPPPLLEADRGEP